VVFLDFSKEKSFNKLYINCTILSNPRTDDVVLAAFADTCLAHASPAQPLAGELGQHVFGLDPTRKLDRQRIAVGDFIKL
jgi:hypothetical protein